MSLNRIQTKQEEQLLSLLHKAAGTRFGRQFGFASIGTYNDYVNQVPVQTYDDIRPFIDQTKAGEQDVLWPGTIRNFAVSSGTTGSGKHLPLSDDRLTSDIRFLHRVVRNYLWQYPDPGLFTGQHLSLPGTVEQTSDSPSIRLGEISGFLGIRSPRWLRFLQIIDPVQLSMMPWAEKFETVIRRSITADLRVISAVPSWILILFREVLKRTGKSAIAEIWPNLRLLVCGGVPLAGYRQMLNRMCHGLPLRYIENYGASEGYFSFNDHPESADMKLVTGNGVFFEFREKAGETGSGVVPLWEVRPGIDYELIVSTNAGLWRYPMNDIITFTQTDPFRIRVTGRLANMLDQYGEALHYNEVRTVLNDFCKNTNTQFRHLFITPVSPGINSAPRHKWFIDWQNAPNFVNAGKMAKILDHELRKINRHYAIRRETNVLDIPIICKIDGQKLLTWLTEKVLNKAQTKVPTIILDEEQIIDLEKMTIA